jgi:hypothetical protein
MNDEMTISDFPIVVVVVVVGYNIFFSPLF